MGMYESILSASHRGCQQNDEMLRGVYECPVQSVGV